MMTYSRISLLLTLLLMPFRTWAVKGPATTTTTSTLTSSLLSSSSSSSPVPTSNSNDNVFLSPIFGLSKRIPAIVSMRGGAVIEPESAQDVDAILIKSGSEQKLVVIDFTATWCGPCKMIAPLFAELSDVHSDVVFLKVDVDEHPETAAKYGVSAMPTFVFLKEGEVVDRLMGANPARLEELIEEHK